MLEQILPGYVAFEQVHNDQMISPLYPEELTALGDVAVDRRDEFARGRHCARRALQQLGLTAGPILIGQCRSPQWPDGIVGSLTHTAEYCGAAVARIDRVLSIGIDAEAIANGPITDELLDVITTDRERRMLAKLPQGDMPWRQVLFSAKESLFKAWQPIFKSWLGFHDTDMTIEPEKQAFRVIFPTFDIAELRDRNMPEVITGRYRVRDGYVGTTIVITV